MAYLPIENHGIIGDMHTAALVGTDGSVDWFCYPQFDSPSVFAAVLDEKKGGRFKIAPADDNVARKQFYWPDTNILVTRFLSADGIGEVTDWMPVHAPGQGRGRSELIRRVKVLRGAIQFRVECNPAFNYGRDSHKTTVGSTGAMFSAAGLQIELATHTPLTRAADGVFAEFTLEEEQTALFVLREPRSEAQAETEPTESGVMDSFKETVAFWRDWLSQSTYNGRWREMVDRSALVLKLLTFVPSGAIVAAPTCSLPERVGGGRNWDYRYSWIRDGAFTLYALLRIGFTEEAGQFMQWLEARCNELEPDQSLQILYSIDGKPAPNEVVLSQLEGYKGSSPVRIGNDAHRQLQLDIYGELMDSVYLYNKYGAPISYSLWTGLRRLIDWVCDNWQRKDDSIWEIRATPEHFVYSKVMCWVAVDRGLRLANKRSFPADHDRWIRVRDQIYEQIMQQGWNRERNAFVQHYGSSALDASSLIMPLVFFMSPSDPQMLKTLDAINRPPKHGGLVSTSLVYRYDVDKTPDGLAGKEGTLNICTFWLVEALARAGKVDPRRVDEARLMFEQMLGHANHLGLYAEETGPTGEALGNFPQAFTHMSLISAAYNLDRILKSSGRIRNPQ
ncbi:MAG: glycoside hydrolase family 15 protein [Chloroflexi bacterium]|nr:glycoside hydrolase family 15 protein [Chloroflexota bacterium]